MGRFIDQAPRDEREAVEIAVVVKRSTDRAILVNHGVPEEVWIPKSQVSDFTGDSVEEAESIFIPAWLAQEKGMI